MKELDRVELDRAKHVATVNKMWAAKEAAKKNLIQEKSTKPKARK